MVTIAELPARNAAVLTITESNSSEALTSSKSENPLTPAQTEQACRHWIWLSKFCIAILKWSAVLLVLIAVLWAYYIYVIQLGFLCLNDMIGKAAYIIGMHLMATLCGICYWRCLFEPTARVPNNWRISNADLQRINTAKHVQEKMKILQTIAKDLPIKTINNHGCIRHCAKCKVIKPDRAHHCRNCGFCVLRMDHHCIWINNCVNYRNHKFFLLLEFYSVGLCLLTCIAVKITAHNFSSAVGYFYIVFIYCLTPAWCVHFALMCYLLFTNRTVIEQLQSTLFCYGGSSKSGYDLGSKYANFQNLFGSNWLLWLLPVCSSKGNGLEYEVREQHKREYYSHYQMNLDLRQVFSAHSENMNNCISAGDPIDQLKPTSKADVVIDIDNDEKVHEQSISSQT